MTPPVGVTTTVPGLETETPSSTAASTTANASDGETRIDGAAISEASLATSPPGGAAAAAEAADGRVAVSLVVPTRLDDITRSIDDDNNDDDDGLADIDTPNQWGVELLEPIQLTIEEFDSSDEDNNASKDGASWCKLFQEIKSGEGVGAISYFDKLPAASVAPEKREELHVPAVTFEPSHDLAEIAALDDEAVFAAQTLLKALEMRDEFVHLYPVPESQAVLPHESPVSNETE
eukprot:GHVU01202777.1.p1 GENE.GHVU01202777.1~~GHVU01202777.1.p1  ORF type:complete len:234 (+),score=58.05 GHVU01202777.1:367-1068(+)